jgi:hypothetical protein
VRGTPYDSGAGGKCEMLSSKPQATSKDQNLTARNTAAVCYYLSLRLCVSACVLIRFRPQAGVRICVGQSPPYIFAPFVVNPALPV